MIDFEQEAGNVLAIIHRDGGHHQCRVGFKQACRDAIDVIIAERTTIDALVEALEWAMTELGDPPFQFGFTSDAAEITHLEHRDTWVKHRQTLAAAKGDGNA
jgi:hypothetical protein